MLQEWWSVVLLLPGLIAIARPNALVAILGHAVAVPLVWSLAVFYALAAAVYLTVAGSRRRRNRSDCVAA